MPTLLLLALAPPLVGDPTDATALVAEVRARFGVVGLAGALVEGGGVARWGADGLRRHGAGESVTVHDVWHVGSCGKAMTATVAARLVERGVLEWGRTVGQAFPEHASEPLASVTLRALLDHRSGLPVDHSAGSLLELAIPRERAAAARRARLERALMIELGAPGEYAYSNTGYVIAGAMIEQSVGREFEAVMAAELFEPLGMGSARIGLAPAGERSAWGHAPGSGSEAAAGPTPLVAGTHPVWYAPAGDVCLSLEDWAAFAGAHLAPGFLAAETLAALHAPPPGSAYAAGFAVAAREGEPVELAHHGRSAGWHAFVALAPSRGYAVLAVCNQGGDAAQAACLALADALRAARAGD